MSGGYPTGSPIFDYSSAVNLVGPTVVAFFIQALETGVIIAQFCFFWTHADSPSCVVKGVVLWVCTVAMFQTGAFFAKFWDIFVTHFGGVTDAGWLTSVQPLVTTLMASPVQAFLIWRCFQIFNRNHLLIAPLIVLLVGSIASAIFVTHSFLVDDFSALPVVRHVWAPYILVLSLPALLDVVLTAYLLSFLVRSLRKVYTSRIRRAITRLIVICWEVALPPTIYLP
ncbi:hypothetical protein FA95DRAFT_579872 [Auriscalpium vulgare]|uniref:Uncharacterized protein n=1 Tax=Auriscalpium vulgare TaxID=40419 RepID=A0ACB8REF8_9AGAM|nr:hypothetical protein FA95DRAFT_579872 [Auriscalpium vulgare]